MAYEPRPHDGSLWGMYNDLIEPDARKLAAYHRAGIAVIVSADRLSYRAERALPGDEVAFGPEDQEASDGD